MLRKFRDEGHPFTVEVQKQIAGYVTGLSDGSGETQLAVEAFALTGPDSFRIRTAQGEDQGRFASADGKLFVYLRERTFVFDEALAIGDESAGSGLHKSAMPGRVTAVHAIVGERVERSAILVVVEAMKMENGLKSEVTGTVRAVNCKVGDLIQPEDMLVEVEVDE